MNQVNSLLFQPIKLGNLELKGRLIKSAMVETMCTDEGFVTEMLIDHYREIAKGGTPLIITGASSFNGFSRGVPRQISVDADDKIPGLKKLADAVHEQGGKIMVQIYHTARQASPAPVGREEAQAPSPVFEPMLGVKPKAMTKKEISETVIQFAEAAERCKKAGMDGVQIHAAHGYLISSFLTPHTNRRKDEYGGSFENRMRFLIEVYRAIRVRVGADYPLILKLNGSDDLPLRRGLSTKALVQIAKRMEEEGINGIEITAGHYESGTTFSRGKWNGYTREVMLRGPGQSMGRLRRTGMLIMSPLMDLFFKVMAAYRPGFNLEYAKEFTQALSVPVICVGGLSDAETMNKALLNRYCDVIAVARGHIADPFLYYNLKNNLAGPKCNYCNLCFTRAGVEPLACLNPTVSKQREEMIARLNHEAGSINNQVINQ